MKKLFLLVLIVVFMTGCSKEEVLNYEIQNLEQRKVELEQSTNQLEIELIELQEMVVDEKVEKGVETYIVTLTIKQSHFSLDVGKHLKDSMNAIEISMPVSKEYYDELSVGQVLDNSFRGGSFWMEGSVGSWDIKVSNKTIK